MLITLYWGFELPIPHAKGQVSMKTEVPVARAATIFVTLIFFN